MAKTPTGTILVAGASGDLGKRIAFRLLEAGESVRAMSRDPDKLTDLEAAGARLVRADLCDADSLVPACHGVSTVLSTANSFMGRGRRGPKATDVPGHMNLMDAAQAAGIGHFCFMSAMVPESFYGIDFFACKQRIENELKQRKFRTTILKPTAFMDTWAQVIGEPLVRTGKTVVFGDGKRPFNLIAVDDVARISAKAVCRQEPGDLVLPFGGPENLSLNEIVRTFRRVTSIMGKVKQLPMWQMAITEKLMAPINPVLARQVKTSRLLARDGAAFDPLETPEPYRLGATTLEAWVTERFAPRRKAA